MSDREKLSILVTEEQKDTIYSLFGHYGWELHETEDSNVKAEKNHPHKLNVHLTLGKKMSKVRK